MNVWFIKRLPLNGFQHKIVIGNEWENIKLPETVFFWKLTYREREKAYCYACSLLHINIFSGKESDPLGETGLLYLDCLHLQILTSYLWLRGPFLYEECINYNFPLAYRNECVHWKFNFIFQNINVTQMIKSPTRTIESWYFGAYCTLDM